MKTNKTLALFVALIIAMSMIGITYTHWTASLNITGTAETGKQKVEIKCYKCGTCSWPCCTKHSTVTCTLSEDKQTLNVEWKNVWPLSKLWILLVIKNAGTIPVDVETPNITFNPEKMQNYFKVYKIFFGPFNSLPQIPHDINSDPPDCWNFCQPPELPVQLDPGQKLVMATCIKFITTCPTFQELQGKTAEITITLNYHQWNLP